MTDQQLKQLIKEVNIIKDSCKAKEHELVIYHSIEETMNTLYDTDPDGEKIKDMFDDILFKRWGEDGENGKVVCDYDAIEQDLYEIIDYIGNLM